MPMPDCWTAYGGSQFIDSAGTGAYMTYLCDELVPFVDERFSTIAAASGRAVQGKSSGGYGALVLAMLRPDLWGGLGDVSGDAAFEHCYLPDVGPAWATLRAYDSIDAFWAWMLDQPKVPESAFPAINLIAMAACYSPGADGPPELPFSMDDGSLRDDVWERWLQWDPVRMLPGHLEEMRGMRAISLECGLQDEFNLHVGTAMIHTYSTTRTSTIASSSSRANTAASTTATRRWSPGSQNGSARTSAARCASASPRRCAAGPRRTRSSSAPRSRPVQLSSRRGATRRPRAPLASAPPRP